MKLDASAIRYLTTEDFRCLTAVEMGSRNHEIVPTTLIAKISTLRGGGVHKSISTLAKNGLIAKVQNAKYDGYRLTYGGYDYLALKTCCKRDSVYAVGNQIGVGKESDVYVVADETGLQKVLKIHRLGRISFRTVKENRDYLRNRKSGSWMYLSRLAAIKEHAFMKILHEHGFPVPKPIDQTRHCIVMEFIDAFPLRQIDNIENPRKLYDLLMSLIIRLANQGLIHGDFNEFNILLRENGEPVLIDFPQMISTLHANAKEQFDRDTQCIRVFFEKRFGFVGELPDFDKDVKREGTLDALVEASGFSKKMAKEFDQLRAQNPSEPENQNEQDLDFSDQDSIDEEIIQA